MGLKGGGKGGGSRGIFFFFFLFLANLKMLVIILSGLSQEFMCQIQIESVIKCGRN